MTIQFIVEPCEKNIKGKLVLPSIFNKKLHTGSPWLYLIHNRGTKHKVWLKKENGTDQYALYSREWKAFLIDSQYVSVKTFHFIRCALDEYYVTGYDNNGFECNGYNDNQVGFRQRRCLVTLRKLEECRMLNAGLFMDRVTQPLRVMVNDVRVSTIEHRFVTISSNANGYVLSGQGWHVLAYVEKLEVGQKLVFTNVNNYTVKMIPFGQSGSGLISERVPRMRLSRRVPFMRCLTDGDPRMKHECMWDNHEQHHDDEIRCFYSPLVAYVTDRSRLTIPSDFIDNNRLQKYHNAFLKFQERIFYVNVDLVPHPENPGRKNHMTINTQWRNVVEECHSPANKMVRFKLTSTGCDPHETMDPDEHVMIPVFHMC